MTTLNPLKKRKEKAAHEAKVAAFLAAYDTKRKPIFEKYRRLLLEEDARYQSIVQPLAKEHLEIVQKLFYEEMAEMKAVDESEVPKP